MQFKSASLAALATATAVSAASYTAGEPYSTLTPTATHGCAATAYTQSFGIAVQPISSGNAKRDVISQITDGQIQAVATTTLAPTTKAKTTSTGTTTTSSSTKTQSSCAAAPSVVIKEQSCTNSGTLQLTLKDGLLTDAKGRIGSIVSNRQFQFDGPTPQAGALYAAGWGITGEGNLALGDQDVFYQCLSGNFYNLYDQKIAEQCSPIHLEIVGLVNC
ncbi:Cis3p KNAG_0C02480 [Huiozyma naganishii CBS 8797]|uniref:Cell wall mannoprotein PIR1-like C-terminal domain-containing protein n=1 Tax=Huiozyma naganishii (strain ATCC MYA-139 / BCRC 22969 / CBS 8797 / KCTC 17520 / NBRC 10181 / NCYC 3082 / Yp74L-3) TaxID=1071383 RepID=J7S4L7_HUIN7|nr:hypothetical protein KNAG_0C02480 [Kazachstania naganishii CBS 8797]CCK69359.1 hypothetical protein KNAG_0C02480 [Kazachstania naganishii CBS 8797]